MMLASSRIRMWTSSRRMEWSYWAHADSKFSRRMRRIEKKLETLSDDEFWEDGNTIDDLRAQVAKGQQCMQGSSPSMIHHNACQSCLSSTDMFTSTAPRVKNSKFSRLSGMFNAVRAVSSLICYSLCQWPRATRSSMPLAGLECCPQALKATRSCMPLGGTRVLHSTPFHGPSSSNIRNRVRCSGPSHCCAP